ncbi:AMSH-like ubiquitin thioesterase 2 [Zea mays]|uniref:AMSH-like ubiquitin thioesterase 2 n=1 Tax=Zea mays TaxID=4577 RepID=A0A1D6G0V9_MAIZE|nr:AMSH-like ubiquitin thioesterase 2 [Zea mays]
MGSRRYDIDTRRCGIHSRPTKSMYLDAQQIVSCQTRVGDHDVGSCAVKHHFPSPIVSWIEDLSSFGNASFNPVSEYVDEQARASVGQSSASSNLHDMQISVRLTAEFMELAKENTSNNLETCGILGASFRDGTYFVTMLIIPKQEGTAHSVMLPEAVAIVVAPTDPTRQVSYGIFRLTEPGGMDVLRECDESGFHTHRETTNGSPIYETCSKVHFNPNLRFEIVDLRSAQ